MSNHKTYHFTHIENWEEPYMVKLNSTQLTIHAGYGHIVDTHSDLANPTFHQVSWSEQTFTITAANTDGSTNVLFANTDVTTNIFVDKNGITQQQTTRLTPEQSRENVVLGICLHSAFIGITTIMPMAPESHSLAQMLGLSPPWRSP